MRVVYQVNVSTRGLVRAALVGGTRDVELAGVAEGGGFLLVWYSILILPAVPSWVA